MGISAPLNEPLFSGSGTSTAVPYRYPIALAGHPYIPDTNHPDWHHQSIPLTRAQADQSATPGEQTINREGLWRRSQSTWHKGAGQAYLDREDSDPARFLSSKGVDVWERWELSLLNDTDAKLTVAAASFLAVAGGFVYATDGTALKRTADITVATPTWTTITGTSGVAITSIASDGTNVYVADGASIYSSANTGTTAASYNTFDASVIGYVKGRLMASKAHIVYNITSGSAPTEPGDAIITGPTAEFRWVGFAAGKSCIYAAGFSGDKSLIYRTTIKDDGTGLQIGIPAGELPDGEIVRSIYSYLGFVFIGTDNGVRFAIPDDSGDLTIGALIETAGAVYCFEGQSNFVWFGWTNYDSTSTGLGRLDPTILNGSAPAFASDLMATAQGAVRSVVTFQDRRVFSVSADAVYAEETTKAPSGTIRTGPFAYGLSDNKMALFLDLSHQPLEGEVAAALAVDGTDPEPMGTNDNQGTTKVTFLANQRVGETFDITITLTRDSGDTTTGPVLTRWTQRANPNADSGEYLIVPILLGEHLQWNEVELTQDPVAELLYLKDLKKNKSYVTYQEGALSYLVTLEDYDFQIQYTEDFKLAGTGVLKLKTLS